jgi:hypothetical protein
LVLAGLPLPFEPLPTCWFFFFFEDLPGLFFFFFFFLASSSSLPDLTALSNDSPAKGSTVVVASTSTFNDWTTLVSRAPKAVESTGSELPTTKYDRSVADANGDARRPRYTDVCGRPLAQLA